MAFEYLQAGSLHNLSGQPVLVVLSSHRALDIQILFCKVAFQPGSPRDVLVPEVVPPQVQDFAFSRVELHEVPVIPFLQPAEVTLNGSMTLWCLSATSSSFVSLAKPLRLRSVPSSRSLMKMLRSTAPDIDPWGTSLVIGLQLNFIPLITTL